MPYIHINLKIKQINEREEEKMLENLELGREIRMRGTVIGEISKLSKDEEGNIYRIGIDIVNEPKIDYNRIKGYEQLDEKLEQRMCEIETIEDMFIDFMEEIREEDMDCMLHVENRNYIVIEIF